MSYARENIARLAPYTPGEQPRGPVVKLNTNENPYPPAPQVLEAIRSVTAESLRKYPPPLATPFRQIAARVHGLSPSQVIATNGGDELLRMAITAFCHPSRSTPGAAPGGLGVAEPSYSLYPVLADIHDTPVTRVLLQDDFSLPRDLADQWNTAGCRLAMIVNPHAPSGRLEPLEQLEQVARRFKGVLLIDEAYVDFAQRDALPLLQSDSGPRNVLILRTLSKGYSLAGLRFGYGLGHADLIEALDKVRDSYNTDILAQAAAVAALEHRSHARQNWARVISERDRLGQELVGRNWQVYPSQSNFLLAVPPGNAARSIYESLKSSNIFVRYFDQDRLRDKLRITVGSPEENNTLLAALDARE